MNGLAVFSRVLAAVAGGYACTAGLVALVAVALPAVFGMARGEAVVLASMGGFVAYLIVLVWVFSTPRLVRVWAVLLGGGALVWGATLWLVVR